MFQLCGSMADAPLRRSKRTASHAASRNMQERSGIEWGKGRNEWADVVQAQLDGKLSRAEQREFSRLTWFTSWEEEAQRLNLLK